MWDSDTLAASRSSKNFIIETAQFFVFFQKKKNCICTLYIQCIYMYIQCIYIVITTTKTYKINVLWSFKLFEHLQDPFQSKARERASKQSACWYSLQKRRREIPGLSFTEFYHFRVFSLWRVHAENPQGAAKTWQNLPPASGRGKIHSSSSGNPD